MINWLEEARGIADKLYDIRRDFHRHPETGDEEVRTGNRIAEIMEGLGYTVTRPMGTSVVAELSGGSGKAVGLRADIDALPVTELTGSEFASETPGKMHACGHDMHMTGAIGAAMLLAAHKEELPGTVRFLFQPNEEQDGGAQRMIDAGAADGLSAVFGAHVDPALPAGVIGIRYGAFYAASATYDIYVHGVGTHAAKPQFGKNPITAASAVALAVRDLWQSLGDQGVVSVTRFEAGTAYNIIPDDAHLAGTMRIFGLPQRAALAQKLTETAQRVAAEYGCTAEVAIHPTYGGIINTDAETALAEETAIETLGEASVERIGSTMISEDVGCFIDKCTGSFYHVGAGCELPLHSPRFLPKEEALVPLAAVHAAILWKAMKR